MLAAGAAAADFAGFVEALEFDDEAGALAGAAVGAGAADFELAGAAAGAGAADDVEELAGAAAAVELADFDFLDVDLVLASAAGAAVASAEADFDFFELVGFVLASVDEALDESAAAAFVDLDFFELADFVLESASAEAVESAAAFVDFDFFELAVEADPLVDFVSASESAALAFFGFVVDDFVEDASALESVVLASAAFFFDLLVFFAVVELSVLLVSAACACAGIAFANPSPTLISNTNRYFSNRFITLCLLVAAFPTAQSWIMNVWKTDLRKRCKGPSP